MNKSADIIISIDAKIIDALVRLNQTQKKILVCTHPDGALAGVIADGDIRRALIDGRLPDDSVASALNPHPVFINEQASAADAQRLLTFPGDKGVAPAVAVNGQNNGLIQSRGKIIDGLLCSHAQLPERDLGLTEVTGSIAEGIESGVRQLARISQFDEGSDDVVCGRGLDVQVFGQMPERHPIVPGGVQDFEHAHRSLDRLNHGYSISLNIFNAMEHSGRRAIVKPVLVKRRLYSKICG